MKMLVVSLLTIIINWNHYKYTQSSSNAKNPNTAEKQKFVPEKSEKLVH